MSSEIEIDDDMTFQRRQWRVERIGWLVMLLIAACALLGLMGSGPLSSAQAGDPSGPISVEYHRFERKGAATALRVQLRPAIGSRQARLWVSRGYLQDQRIEWITPTPEKVEVADDRLIYSFAIAGDAREVQVAFHLQHEQFGRRTARLGLEGGPEVAFSQFIYP